MADIAYRVDTEGFEELKKALSDPQVVKGPVRDFLQKSARTVEARAKEKAPADMGRLRTSIEAKISELEATIGPAVSYAPYLEFGTRPHFPPLAALQPWAQRHGFPEGNRGAFLVARKIAAKGTPPRPYMLPALNESKGEIDGFLEDLANDIERRMMPSG